MKTYLQLLNKFISFKSISTDPNYKTEVNKTSLWLEHLFKQNGFKTKVFKGYGNPVVYGYFEVDPKVKTYLIYGHYDVQPAERADGWKPDPFTVTKRSGRLYARGVVDNKGQTLIHIATIIDLIKIKALKYNIIFLIEGDEETGSGNIGKLLKDNKKLLACDEVLISDGEMPYQPMITASFRGFLNLTLRYKTAKTNLHSGLFGGIVPNAAEELARLIACMHNNERICQIDDFYKGIAVTPDEIQKARRTDPHKKRLLQTLGIKKHFPGKHKSLSVNLGFNTMITVSGFKSGYIGDGYSNIVPNSAEARINFRIAHGQAPKEMLSRFVRFVKQNTPSYVQYEFIYPKGMGRAIKINVDSPTHKQTGHLLAKVYGTKPLIDYCGATIPIVADFQEILGVNPLLISLGNDDCNMHGVDENFDIGLIKKGLEFSKRFFS